MPSARDTFLAFDPNDKNNDPWGTYVPARAGRNKFKTHRTRGTALTSLMSNKWHGLAKLYSWDSINNGWKLEVTMDREAKNHTCDNCGGDTVKDYSAHTYRPWSAPRVPGMPERWGDAGSWCWRRQGGRIATPLELLFVCEICYPAFKR